MNGNRVKTPSRISYAFGVKMNTGNYESTRIDISYSRDVKPGEKANEALANIQHWVEKKVEEKAADVYRRKKPWVRNNDEHD